MKNAYARKIRWDSKRLSGTEHIWADYKDLRAYTNAEALSLVCTSTLWVKIFAINLIQWTLVTTTASVPKEAAIKMNLLLYRVFNEQMVWKKVLVLFLFPDKTYVLDIC